MTGTPALLWTDCESSSLDERTGNLLEVGFRVTDADLATITEASWVVWYRPVTIANIRAESDAAVRLMHDASGLWAECTGTADDLGYEYARDWFRDGTRAAEIIEWLLGSGAKGMPLAGSTVGFDRRWLNHWLPGFEQIPHYRSVDVSTVKILMQLWAPDRLTDAPVPAKRHRVMPDLDDSIAELAHYRRVLGLDLAEVAR